MADLTRALRAATESLASALPWTLRRAMGSDLRGPNRTQGGLAMADLPRALRAATESLAFAMPRALRRATGSELLIALKTGDNLQQPRVKRASVPPATI